MRIKNKGEVMGPRLRKMKTYHPRRRTRGKEVYKQAIFDIKHRLSRDVNGLIVLIKEGNPPQISAAQLKAKTDFQKYSEEMQQLAQKMGSKYLKAVNVYLSSVDNLVHTTSTWFDEDKIRQIYFASEKLDRELSAA